MRNLLALTSRELKALWYTPIAYVMGAVILFAQGVVFYQLLAVLNDPLADPSWTMAQVFFGGTFYYWFAQILTAPFLTMRTFSEEKHSGTIELLLTAPVTETQVVLGKFLGAWLTYVLLWSSTVVFFVFLRTLTVLDWGPVLTGYLGTWLLGGALIGMGVLASSLTRNQIISGVMASVSLLLLFAVAILQMLTRDPQTAEIISYLSIIHHLGEFSKGLLDTRPIVFYLTITAISLFLTGRVITNPRWRS